MNSQENIDNVQKLFETKDFNEDNTKMDKIRKNCKNDNDFKEINVLKKIFTTLIIEGINLNLDTLDSRGNKKSKWSIGEKRGGFDYIPPTEGWKGFGLNVLNKYDNGNNDWISKDGNKNEWAVAYHGVGTGLNNLTLEKVVNCIIKEGFKPGNGQSYANDDDDRHPGQKVGKGVYCSPDPNVMEAYASYSQTSININKRYFMIGFMLRVKPDKIRYSKSCKDYWVLNGNTDEMRPYRILVKEQYEKDEKEQKNYSPNYYNSIVRGSNGWSLYIQNRLLNMMDNNGHIYNNIFVEAAIIGINGIEWGRTMGLFLKNGELNTLKKLFQMDDYYYTILNINLAGKKYRVIHHLKDELVYLQKGDCGAVIFKTKLAFVIGIYNSRYDYKYDGQIKKQNLGISINIAYKFAMELKKFNY